MAQDPNFVAMFFSEARLASQLNHPNIAQIIEYGESDGVNFLAMEYVDGPSLRALSRAFRDRGEPLPFSHCARIVAAACEALSHAHELLDPVTGLPLQLVHRDVSPDNILISRGGAVKLVDFGVAKAITQVHHTKTGTVKGKLSYMSPEQLRAQPLDRRADVYSLGVVLYELVAGAKPYAARNEVELFDAVLRKGERAPVRSRRPDTPPELERIIDRAMERDRELRYTSCRVMHADLEQFIISTRQPVSAFQISELVQRAAVPDQRATDPAQPPAPPENEQTDPSRTSDFLAPGPPPLQPPPPPAEAEAPPPDEKTDVSLEAPVALPRDTGPLPPPDSTRTRVAVKPSRTRSIGLTVLAVVAVMGAVAGVLAARARTEAPPPAPRAAAVPRPPAEDARALLEKARPLLEGPSPDLAEAPLLRCLELDRASAECHLALGKLYARLKNEDGAAEHYLALLRLSPEHPRAPEARAFLRDSAQLRYEQGRVLLKAKDYDEAKLRLIRCLELDPTFADCHVLLGAAYARLRQPEKGAEQYRAYLRLLPDGDRAAEVKKLLQDYGAGAGPDGGAAHSP